MDETLLQYKIAHVVGARPNFVKAAPVIRELAKLNVKQFLIHTGQHYDNNMSKAFYNELDIPEPNINLDVKSSSHAQQTAMIMEKIEKTFIDYAPQLLIVYGDVNSTIAGALVATKLGIKVAHVEAGLRSFDRTMPEEINRLLTDRISDICFTTTMTAKSNLISENVHSSIIYFVGNTMIDTLDNIFPDKSKTPNTEDYALVTCHRPSNVDTNEGLTCFLRVLKTLSRRMKVIFPIHPRTQANIECFKLSKELNAIDNL